MEGHWRPRGLDGAALGLEKMASDVSGGFVSELLISLGDGGFETQSTVHSVAGLRGSERRKTRTWQGYTAVIVNILL